jgi:diphthamide synthase (EF-2-diphthine--ammonia ligase)
MIDGGLRAVITCVDTAQMERSFIGRLFDEKLLEDLASTVDPCGENGEFHTAATAGPTFSKALEVEAGEVVLRDGFVYMDIVLKKGPRGFRLSPRSPLGFLTPVAQWRFWER